MGKKKNRKSVFIKLNDLRYLAYIFPMVENQPLKYTEAMPDVMKCTRNTKFDLICGTSCRRQQQHPLLSTI